MAWGGMEMPFPWTGIPEMIEVPINYLETAGDQHGSRREVQKESSSQRVPGNSGERRSHLRHIPQPLVSAAGGVLTPHISILSCMLAQWLVKVRKAIGKEMQGQVK